MMHILQIIQLSTFYNLSLTSSLKSGFIARHDNRSQTIGGLLCTLSGSNSVFVLCGFSGFQCRKKNSIVLMSQRNGSALSWAKSLFLTPDPGFQRFYLGYNNFGFNRFSVWGVQNEEHIKKNNRKCSFSCHLTSAL